MSASSLKSNSSASRPRATKRQKSTPRTSAKAPKASRTPKTTRTTATARSAKAAKSSRTSSVRARSASATLRTQGQTSSRLGASQRAQMATSRRSGATESKPSAARIGFIAAVSVGVLAIVAIATILVLSRMPVFVITSINAEASEHVTAESIAKLANVEEGTTLLSADMNQIRANIKRNPWVQDVSLSREFPDTLSITVTERQVGAVVVIGAGASVWALGTDGIWIEPIHLDTAGVDVGTAALSYAKSINCLLIADVPASVDPAQGSVTTDASILAALQYQEELSSDITSQARVYYASSEGSISLVLDTGVEISLGSPEDITSKSLALNEIMSTYPNQLTYINVRVPSKPTYRKVPDGTTISSVEEVVESLAVTSAATTDSAQTEGASEDTSSEDSE